MLLDGERIGIDLSADASPPLNSSDRRTRQGLANLKATLEIGPKLNLLLDRGDG